MNNEKIEITKKEALELLMLLSALESWAFADAKSLPDMGNAQISFYQDYLWERMADKINKLSEKILI